MSEAMAPCPPDSAIMKAWKAYQETESFKNSLRYVTVEQRKELLPPSDPTANAVTDWHRDQWAEGSMWAAFMSGWLAARGADPFSRTPQDIVDGQ
jgi:hypothetical protein